MKSTNIFLWAVTAVLLLSGCGGGIDIANKQEYPAYGRLWRYTTIEHHGQRWGLFTGHGYIGLVDTIQQEVFLETDGREEIPVHDRIYALQNDGTYKKIRCCDDFGALANVYQVDDKLFLYLSLGRNITDCFVYPAGQPDNEKLPPEKRIRVIEYFGEFDPELGMFYVNSFDKGDIGVQALYGNAPNWKELWSHESLAAYTTRLYLHRSPFECSIRPN